MGKGNNLRLLGDGIINAVVDLLGAEQQVAYMGEEASLLTDCQSFWVSGENAQHVCTIAAFIRVVDDMCE